MVAQPQLQHAHTERIHIRRRGGDPTLADLWRHVGGRAGNRSGDRGHSRAIGLVDGPCDAEVQHLDPAVAGEEQVVRLDIAVHDPQGVRCRDPAGRLAGPPDQLFEGDRLAEPAMRPIGEGLAFEQLQLHDQITLVPARAEEADHARMMEALEDPRLLGEACQELVPARELGLDHLDRAEDRLVDGRLTPEDRGHATVPDQRGQ